jgi:hypothetical protein
MSTLLATWTNVRLVDPSVKRPTSSMASLVSLLIESQLWVNCESIESIELIGVVGLKDENNYWWRHDGDGEGSEDERPRRWWWMCDDERWRSPENFPHPPHTHTHTHTHVLNHTYMHTYTSLPQHTHAHVCTHVPFLLKAPRSSFISTLTLLPIAQHSPQSEMVP